MSLQEQKTPLVGIVMGSDSDLEKMAEAAKVLEEFDVPFEITISSAHRSPARTMAWTEKIKAEGGQVIIAGAGRAAHLAGVIAAHTTLPVIGVPIDGGPLNGVGRALCNGPDASGYSCRHNGNWLWWCEKCWAVCCPNFGTPVPRIGGKTVGI